MSLLFVEHGVRDMMNDSDAIVASDQSHAAILFNIPLLGLQDAAAVSCAGDGALKVRSCAFDLGCAFASNLPRTDHALSNQIRYTFAHFLIFFAWLMLTLRSVV